MSLAVNWITSVECLFNELANITLIQNLDDVHFDYSSWSGGLTVTSRIVFGGSYSVYFVENIGDVFEEGIIDALTMHFFVLTKS